MPNILDDIIASVVENKIPATKMARVGLNQDSLPEGEVGQRPEGVKLDESPLADPHAIVPHDWLGNHRLLWLKDHHHQGNQKLFKENWTQEQVCNAHASGVLTISLQILGEKEINS